jgi:fermentation-respiration switch protein FrsA (DUF1100 family)
LVTQKHIVFLLGTFLSLLAGCSVVGEDGWITSPGLALDNADTVIPPTSAALGAADLSTTNAPISSQAAGTIAQTPSPTQTFASTPTATEVVFEVGKEITIQYLQNMEIIGSPITFEEKLADGPNYHRYIVSYISEGNRIYGLLTIPFADPPETGYKAIVFNHGYIPPAVYRTTERYNVYVDNLARSGFVVFKIDYRGHGKSEGEPTGSYFSPGYTIDSIAALKSLQTLVDIDPEGIGMWGHSMAGNLVLRAMLIEPDIKAGVIWAGAVYSYDDFAQYGIDDNTYRPPATPEDSDRRRRSQEIFEAYGRPDTQTAYWKAVSLSENIDFLNSPLQLHHADDDAVVSIGYSEDLAAVLLEKGKEYEFYRYEGGGHNLASPYFSQAMQRTVEFLRDHL